MEFIDFSIIIATYNRPIQLTSCLEALTQIDYREFEVIVVDDGSSESLQPIILPFQSRLKLTLIEQKNQGPAAARNAGAKIATGDYIVFTDDDCIPQSTWLTALAKSLQVNPNNLVGGKILNALPDNPYASTSQGIIDVVYDYYHTVSKPLRFFASNNFALSREAFNDLGGFNETFWASEDREFCDRWLQAGYSLTYIPEAIIFHAHDLNLSSFWQQHFNYGRGAYRFYQIRAKRGSEGLKVEPQFYRNLVLYPFSFPSVNQFFVSFWLNLFIAQLANLFGYFWEKRQFITKKSKLFY
ncbi:glycosyl transferase [Aphanothece hegewaldii CCALA 016]|uniref:Glycosyl transferase n=1 Tax=Aphanothece hegewaldii CCALA 016 TaxID=2107694 RepID=A0A2T1LZK9_9CHRO|nr:glycosyltransferase [Aphanothece hegewaldii]PSF37810.1 glycosyl transferase [Aphanothece hegewaldii CCALA 016]